MVAGRNSIYPSQALTDISWRSPVIVVTHLTTERTLMFDAGNFLFSNFVGVIDEVLKDDTNKLSTGDSILITREGGQLTLDGVLVKAIDPEFSPFKQGQKYLLFLNAVPNSNFYQATNQNPLS